MHEVGEKLESLVLIEIGRWSIIQQIYMHVCECHTLSSEVMVLSTGTGVNVMLAPSSKLYYYSH